MKKIAPIFIIAGLLLVIGCRKKNNPPTSPVSFKGTVYKVEPIDASGRPTNITTVNVSTGLISFLNNTLPERIDLRKANNDLLTTQAIADIAVTQRSSVSITFVSQNTENANAIGYYKYATNSPPAGPKDIKEIVYIFPNAGGIHTQLKSGDKIILGTFDPGISIGFVLLKNAWNNDTKTLNNEAVHFCSNDVLNPEFDPNLKKHAVLIKYNPENVTLIGFEDVDRTDNERCDHDFNDVVVYATVTPN